MNEQPTSTSERRAFLGSAVALAGLAGAGPAAAQPTSGAGRFAGKVVLITGATSGIGRTTAEAFAREGAKLMFCGRREALGREVEAGIRRAGGDAVYRRTDVREHAQVKALVDACVERFGRLDIAFNNAGTFMTPVELQDIPVDNFMDHLLTNTGGVFFGMKHQIPVMRRQGSGVIVNMASVAAHKGFAITAQYNASKHGIIGLTKAAAVAHAKHGLRINSISPLAVDTPQLRESLAFQKVTFEQVAPSFVTPRVMRTEEIASAVLFLASEQASAINGMDLDVTGGQLA